jgi:hypothetical protein
MKLFELGLYAAGWIVAVYLFNALLAGRLQKINTKKALLYVATMSALGIAGEIFVGTFYTQFFHHPFWLWKVFPIYSGYTSLYAPLLWGIYGFQLYLFHDNLERRHIENDEEVAVIFGFESIFIEILLNISFLAFFGHYIFFYSPTDLWHFSSIQTFPFFFIASLIFTKVIRREKAKSGKFTMMNIILCAALIAIE